ncbi:amidase signature domain-containing protein [Podospora didyma]|uniref:Amidase signature domain-containing protein n=1 Tax=Podospora didyma TaxID=330526 RepID=A0AAE0NUB0_9PEZI|nr:amidase signature domain-containing protein [Podospora didyma]
MQINKVSVLAVAVIGLASASPLPTTEITPRQQVGERSLGVLQCLPRFLQILNCLEDVPNCPEEAAETSIFECYVSKEICSAQGWRQRLRLPKWMPSVYTLTKYENVSGSSSGCAAGVAAGYAPLAIGTETDGSLVICSGRAALYTIKPTIGLVHQDGTVPISHNFDAAGPMTKSTYDLAVLLDILASRNASESFTAHLAGSWSDISVAVLDPDIWKFPEDWVKPVDGAEAQMVSVLGANPIYIEFGAAADRRQAREIREAYDKVQNKAKKFEIMLGGESTEGVVMIIPRQQTLICPGADLKQNLNAYLEDLDESEVRSLEDVIQFNVDHADVELPSHHPSQDNFLKAQDEATSAEKYERCLAHFREVTRDRWVERVLEAYGVDIILAPTDRFPLCGMPLSYLDYNDRPFGVSAIAGRNQDAMLVKVMSASEATFPPRQVPPQLVEEG